MSRIYQVTIHGTILESKDLKKLLARAVHEKRDMDRRVRSFWAIQHSPLAVCRGILSDNAELAGQVQ